MAWAWQSLAQTAPLSAPAKDPNDTYKEAIILLSDGLNTQDRWYVAASIDTRQKMLCKTPETLASPSTRSSQYQQTGGSDVDSVVSMCERSFEVLHAYVSDAGGRNFQVDRNVAVEEKSPAKTAGLFNLENSVGVSGRQPVRTLRPCLPGA